ncbi:23S rRNA (uracil(1939)-C(5))-methyltransferase RlmD [Paenibacillus thiaminolyticus]|uniref:23S rRNA (Uracil(1939)-C(5))-methyltransferase RlmD n=1 Tax=Paenibacillus thiaminolyticus TaxID=49283 RepID=A0AAP9DWK1_PANTH|nr:23S rRNA (uracil(1939)-C(5))-methyltransferase RlmD [Paenibacillus thiaminolyticus]MCY9535336.1 23S rRNA (uracil(1939)-C(5))-methyltransferase RlmD [Paenibacillus thiaminolyticus]MCY9602597.1 23S rRNA (uracil(1939)-C(5))-methyltransferase RlmD [Paenibacillus thiaminolyticus]MCY9606249.1 23S rRNA (uracil(1939)-C(5))-methyltransferase RlmD [Paenibacillus thiaminolyticus]MCY9612641.1 23S rRNA (uracil(1939)-C(5))-methyltransferase RlmD [Paenibacillus thiaminolyticus]MCY9621479.1 23S rRNA (uraci
MTGKKLGNGAERRKRRGTAAAVRARAVGAKSAEANSAEARTAEGSTAKKRGQAGQKSASAPVSKNDEVVLDIIGLTHDGEGVGRADGFTLFVSGALPGEQVRALVLKVKKQYGYAKVLERLIDSAHRVELEHPVNAYGGCQLQHLEYGEQLRWKRQHVVDVLERIGKFQVEHGAETGDADGQPPIKVLPVIGMEHPWRYRNKSQMPIGADPRTGELIGGYFAKASHRIIDTDVSLLQHERNDEAMRAVKRIARKYGIAPYNEETHTGLLRHAIMRVGFRTDEQMITLVTNGEKLPHEAEIVADLVEALPQLTSICQNINTKRTNVIMGEKTRVLWGSEYITDYIGDIAFKISARSFYQVNPVQTEVLYDKAVEYAGLTGNETVIDAYCGIGTISLFLAQRAKRVLGVEIVEEAIADARRNAELNGVTNAEFAVGAAEDVIPRWKEQGVTPDVIVVDPPRKGCDTALLDTMLAMRPERIVYVSCNPSTLARDVRVLADGGYRVLEVQPVDMFPQTTHVECCSLLVRND